MAEPHFPLGVELMDDDHARLEQMLAEAAVAPDAGLAAALKAVRAEMADHFAREEALMRDAAVPVYACHVAQHSRILEDIDGALDAAPDLSRLRAFTSAELPNLLMSHIASVDQISARFLTGDLDPGMVAQLRLPQEPAAQEASAKKISPKERSS